MSNINIAKKELIHFVGIGGIGMCGLAQIMKTMGFSVQGSDLARNKNTDNCNKRLELTPFVPFSYFCIC